MKCTIPARPFTAPNDFLLPGEFFIITRYQKYVYDGIGPGIVPAILYV